MAMITDFPECYWGTVQVLNDRLDPSTETGSLAQLLQKQHQTSPIEFSHHKAAPPREWQPSSEVQMTLLSETSTTPI
jgi:hypothetical protein